MSEAQRFTAPSEPGHRYVPRQVGSRYADVHASTQRSFAPHPDPVPEEKPLTQQAAVPLTPASTSRPDVAPQKHVQNKAKVATQEHRGNTKPARPRLHRSLVLRRQIVDRAAQHKRQSQDLRKRMFVSFAFGGMVASLLAVGMFVYYSSHQSKKQVLSATTYSPTPGGAAAASNIATASESPVSQADISNYKTSTGMPRVLSMPSLGTTARVYAVKADMGGNPLPTNNIFDIGWLMTSAKPGESGAALLNGYVDGATKPGVLANVSNLAVGDSIQVERGDGTVVRFKVVGSKQYPADSVDMKAATTSAIAGRPGLNILTNTGRFDVRRNQFEPRTLVFAVLE